MADRTAIEWAANADGTPGASWNPIRARRRSDGARGWFCTHASEGCRNCYAERLNVGRFGNGVAYKAQNTGDVEIYLDVKTLAAPLRWKKPRTIFVCSMSDLFGEFVPDAFIDRVFAIAALCPQHTFIVLTKRARRMREYVNDAYTPDRVYDLAVDAVVLDPRINVVLIAPGMDERAAPDGPRVWLDRWPLANVWLGVSCEDQKNADARIPALLDTPAAVRFVSAEPLLCPIDLTDLGRCGFNAFNPTGPARAVIDWVIVGGESGKEARLMRPDWARSLRDQCAAAGVPFFFKQWGEWAPWPHWTEPRTEATPPIIELRRVGKSRAGRLLDGREHNDRPPIAAAERA